jgi:acetyltransferase-like isoleucine patch superfamily enzyme
MIHESAFVEDAEIGEGTNIWHFVHIRKGSKIGKNCNIGKGVYIDINVKIGNNCKLQNFATLYDGVTVGNDVFIGPHVCFTNDVFPRASIWTDDRLVKTLVNDGASIGANATIIAGVTIGNHAMVGAGSVVTKNVPDYALVVGNPAMVKGFVCECGVRLQEKSKKDRVVEFVCPKCGKEISIDEDVCKEIK